MADFGITYFRAVATSQALFALAGCSWSHNQVVGFGEGVAGSSNADQGPATVGSGADASCGIDWDADLISQDASAIDGRAFDEASLFSCPGIQQVTDYGTLDSADAAVLGPVPDSQQIDLAIGLPMRNEEQLTQFVSEVSNPQSSCYRHYLTLDQLTAAFGPTQADYQSLIDWCSAVGLTITATYPNRLLLDVSGSAAVVNRAFCMTLYSYSFPTGLGYAPNQQPTLNLALPVDGVEGLAFSPYSYPVGIK